ncbi:hypothetical protein CTI12_AA315410 [Artemisia annua]|uniref:Uncharacterized protein n=1 Tax=Artemisia annua TaxID=35608 RepID=A0A2U1N2I5_ARTAN|nr:hypothetical protein CTI12_AA315410 [Artemisia annua]
MSITIRMRTRKRSYSSVAKSQVSSNSHSVAKSQKKKKCVSWGSSYARIVATDPNIVQLRGHGLSANEITLFARYLEQNPQIVSHAFLNMKGDQEKINFIRELDLTPYKDNPNPNQ